MLPPARGKGGQRGAKGETGKMSETQALLSRIVSLRQRLEQAHSLARAAGASAAGKLTDPLPVGPARIALLKEALSEGAEHARQFDYTVRPLIAARESGLMLPAQLTARARRVLERARDLFQSLRG